MDNQLDQSGALRDAALRSLTHLVHDKDPATQRHVERTRHYVRILAEALRDHPRFRDCLSDGAIDALYESAPLHDIGKAGVPTALLGKKGTLTEQEYEVMKRHVDHGAEVLRAVEQRVGIDANLAMAARIAYQHHERWDGTGYPQGLKGEDIHFSARLMSLADVYDALTSRRPYKEAWSHEDVRRYIEDEKEKHFDPAVVEAFLEREEEFRRIAERQRDG